MKILILSYYFPPHAGMGALRVDRLADYLLRAGHEVEVVAARGPNAGAVPPLEPVFADAAYTRWLDINYASDQASRLKNWILSPMQFPGGTEAAVRSQGRDGGQLRPARGPGELLSRLDRLYRHCLNIPDDKVGWLPFALRAGGRRARAFQPDVIYASSPPPSALVAAAWLSRRLGVPWVAEIRDRWADDPYDPRPRWRMALDRRLERRVLTSARGIVTVSETWAQAYRELYGKPTAVITNGFSPEDYDNQPAEAPPEAPPGDRERLRIVYTGVVYAGRDPAPLFRALACLGPAADGIRIEFCGGPGGAILADAAQHGVARHVLVREQVPHGEAVALQCGADVLLLLQWNNPSEAGNIPGKLFEYLGARRPILALGFDGGEMARIVQERKAGLLANDPQAIAAQLAAWCEEKRATGHIAPLTEAARAGFTRDEQFEKLEGFLEGVLGTREDPGASGR